MDEPAQLNSLITQRVREAVRESQTEILHHMDTMIKSSFEKHTRETNENQRQLSESQLAKIEEMNSDNYVFKRKGNEEQFKVNTKIANKMKEARCFLREDTDPSEPKEKAVRSISEGLDLLAHRQKLVKLADQSESGWKTVTEYETHSLADDSEDEKRIIRAENRAARKIKTDKRNKQNRSTPYRTPPASTSTMTNVPIQRPGKCYECGIAGHWRIDHRNGVLGQKNKSDKISKTVNLLRCNSFSENIHENIYDSIYTQCDKSINVCVNKQVTPEVGSIETPVGRLRSAYDYWVDIGANDSVLDIIKYGYKLPFFTVPENCYLDNNRSALDNTDFVESEISKLLNIGCIEEADEKPFVINPLTVAQNRNKLRLVLDCRHINPHLHKFKFKYEDAVVASQMFEKGDSLFTYDLRSAYHHIHIFDAHRSYLGFSWYYKNENKIKYFVFNVLPFGISTAGYIFTKVVRCIIKHLRDQGLKVIMYLDDGIGGSKEIGKAHLCSITVQKVLKSAGFLIAEEKCNWVPSLSVTWLGLVWNMEKGVVYVTDRRLNKLQDTLKVITDKMGQSEIKVTARFLASIIGQIISMQGAIGPVVRLRTRSMYACLLSRASWNAPIIVSNEAVSEIVFWKENTAILNGRELNIIEQYSSVVYTDASGTGYGGYVVNLTDHEIMGSWNFIESCQSSTWRELEAVYRVLKSIVDQLKGQKVKWYTDNQNIVHIMNKGSRKVELQNISIEIANVCFLHSITLLPQWIPREQNVKADEISKQSDCDDWEIDIDIFSFLDNLWGPHTVDRFASDYNTKCKVFNSKCWCPGTTGINSLEQHWGMENNWVVPPPSIAGTCIQKMKQEKANGTLIVPFWKSAPFWPLLHTNKLGITVFEYFVAESKIMSSDIVVRGRGRNGIFGQKHHDFNMLVLKIRF